MVKLRLAASVFSSKPVEEVQCPFTPMKLDKLDHISFTKIKQISGVKSKLYSFDNEV